MNTIKETAFHKAENDLLRTGGKSFKFIGDVAKKLATGTTKLKPGVSFVDDDNF